MWWPRGRCSTRRSRRGSTASCTSRRSSCYGFDFEGEVDERTPVRPNGVHYVDTKIASEQVVLAAHASGEIPCTIVRPGDVYGPRSRPWTLEPVRLLKAGQSVLPGRGRGMHSPVYVEDLVEGILRAATVPEAAGRIFTITGPEHVSIGEFIEHYSRMLGRDGPRALPPSVARAGARLVDAVARLRGVRNELTPAAVDYFMRRGTYSIARCARGAGLRACGGRRGGHGADGGVAARGGPHLNRATLPAATRRPRAPRLQRPRIVSSASTPRPGARVPDPCARRPRAGRAARGARQTRVLGEPEVAGDGERVGHDGLRSVSRSVEHRLAARPAGANRPAVQRIARPVSPAGLSRLVARRHPAQVQRLVEDRLVALRARARPRAESGPSAPRPARSRSPCRSRCRG